MLIGAACVHARCWWLREIGKDIINAKPTKQRRKHIAHPRACECASVLERWWRLRACAALVAASVCAGCGSLRASVQVCLSGGGGCVRRCSE